MVGTTHARLCPPCRFFRDNGQALVICPTIRFSEIVSSPFGENNSFYQKDKSGVW
jgi:hypothetical protein